jgi:hypothetical protein
LDHCWCRSASRAPEKQNGFRARLHGLEQEQLARL